MWGFSETAAFGSYGVNTSEKANMPIRTGLPRAGLLALCIFKAQKAITTAAVMCSSFRDLSELCNKEKKSLL